VSDAAWFGMPNVPKNFVQQEMPINGFMGAWSARITPK
jgi:hypothetical protein